MNLLFPGGWMRGPTREERDSEPAWRGEASWMRSKPACVSAEAIPRLLRAFDDPEVIAAGAYECNPDGSRLVLEGAERQPRAMGACACAFDRYMRAGAPEEKRV